MRERFRLAHGRVHGIAASDEEHLAVLELLLLVALADGLVGADETDCIRDEVEGGGWESDTFSYQGRLGPAMARVRALPGGERDTAIARLVATITSPALRAGALVACKAVAAADGRTDPQEAGALAIIERAFAGG